MIDLFPPGDLLIPQPHLPIDNVYDDIRRAHNAQKADKKAEKQEKPMHKEEKKEKEEKEEGDEKKPKTISDLAIEAELLRMKMSKAKKNDEDLPEMMKAHAGIQREIRIRRLKQQIKELMKGESAEGVFF